MSMENDSVHNSICQSRYIDVEIAKSLFKNWKHGRSIMEKLDTVPTANVVPAYSCQCFHCGSAPVIWQSDFSFEDYGYGGNGIVQCCYCPNCGAEIEYRISLDDEDKQ